MSDFIDTLETYYNNRDDQGNLRVQQEQMPDEFEDDDEDLDDLDENDEMEDVA